MTIEVSPELTAHPIESTTAQADTYLSGLLAQRQPLDPQVLGTETAAFVQDLRDRATALAQELTIPTTREEEWRFTDLSPLRTVQFTAIAPEQSPARAEQISGFVLPESSLRLVFVNGRFAPELSDLQAIPSGLKVGTLAGQTAQLNPYLAQQAGSEEIFTVLNTASFSDAAVIQVDRNQQIEAPLHLLFIAVPTSTPTIAHPRCLVMAETSSRLTLVEEYVTVGTGVQLTNAVTEIWLGSNAEVNHIRIQAQALDGFHIGKTAVSQARDSRYTGQAISLGGQISRHNLEVHSAGEQTQTTLNGLTLATGEQLSDTHSTIAFTKPYCTSQQLHKCIVSDRARAVFNGKVFVPKAAQLTDAAQLNRNLLLSPKARIDTKPQLEIVADNVKCSHGATVSQLEEDEIFYLRSRGLNYQDASNLLVKGFAVEMLELIPVPSLRQRLTTQILSQIHL
uniref:FeS assembly protein SufD n=1 Tax=Cyanothece sp. (strain PCC 7425 / ATCC 29141) TaxID=395961 RepID=B8HQU6_CYAP4